MSFLCTTPRYDILYARWLEHPEDLLVLAEWKPGQKLLDLCGGTGAITREALQRGALPESLYLVDLNPRAGDTGVHQIQSSAEDADLKMPFQAGRFDAVICRQAFCYLNPRNVTRVVFRLLKHRGTFVFNTFVKPKWSLKIYTYGGKHYLEASAYIRKTVWHIQVCLGVGWDITTFKWQPKEDVLKVLLEEGFKVQTQETAKSIRWVCRKEG